MNEALINELDKVFYSSDYGERKVMKEVNEAHKAYYDYLEPYRKSDSKMFFALEDLIASAEVEHERQGFLRGYQYCLTMLGICRGEV